MSHNPVSSKNRELLTHHCCLAVLSVVIATDHCIPYLHRNGLVG